MMTVIRVILAILLPPIAMLLTVGIGLHFWINLVLSIFGTVILPGFGHIPAILHALWYILTQDDKD